ncbi:MAG: iron-sulfur cluster assembly scaffold protein [Rhodospirillales bacterium]|nr:iron-sulfur cluster assembly scaffold protein [Rhodospirillales bacterium]
MNDEIYHAEVKRLAQAATGAGRLAPPKSSATLDNPLCGDRATIDLELKAGTIARLSHEVKGCLMCRAAAAILGVRAPGASLAQARQAVIDLRALLKDGRAIPPEGWAELAVFTPLGAHKSRHDCALLPFDALVQALDAAGKS